MSPDVMQLEELPIEEISSPLTAQILDFCSDDGAGAAVELFQQSDHSQQQQQQHHLLLLSSDVSSSSPTTTATAATPTSPFCCYADDDASFSPFPSLDAATLSALLDSTPPPLPFPPAGPEPDLVQAAGYDCSSSSSSTAVTTATATSTNPAPTAMFPISSSFQDPFEHIMLAGVTSGGYGSYSGDQMVPATVGGPLSHQHYQQQQIAAAAYDEDPRYADASALGQQLPGFMGMEAAVAPPLPYGFFGGESGGGMGGFYHNGGGSGIGEAHGLFGGEMMVAGLGGPASDVGEYQNGGLGMYGRSDPMQQSYNSGDLQQVIGGNGQHLMTGCSSSSTTVTATTDTSTVEESTFKVGRLSVEERKEKIHRYMKKRNERNFSKKIKYACRKTLADSRPRVRGRFAKNDETGEASRATSSNHEYDDDEEVNLHGAVKEGEDMLDSSDILAHISGVNSFRYNYSLESWV